MLMLLFIVSFDRILKCIRILIAYQITELLILNFIGKICRLTVFRSNELPITVCNLEEANHIYQECLGTELLKIPVQGTDRLSKWPGLEPTDPFTVTGTNRKISSNDVVLSSSGNG